ncbi:spore protease YyaC [Amphibacillus sp. MSJ-3]|uniref:spore protease YyaC n=1 Tax=Amphibacillus sp. MSJ-3 TaxID=2841505 RepID=UPI001C0ED408|nr:spore protease YyaC [Amphibacillus sp. MSJ-3]MBU5594452.1 spore protease YyaC [Amphibacillus sp. MSJ-3]
MKLSNQAQSRPTKLSLCYTDQFVHQKIGEFIYQWLPKQPTDFVIVCIGSDRSTGDALGPITGSLLTKRKQSNYIVYGTLQSPIHALNLKKQLKQIDQRHPDAFVIGIDACLGKASSIGYINASIGALKPGLALKKDLPEVGHFHLTGIVNATSPVDFLTLQNTRLHLVIQQAEIISRALLYSEYLYFKEETASQ